MNLFARSIGVSAVAATAVFGFGVSPASAAIVEAAHSNAQPLNPPGTFDPDFNCLPGERWIYVSTVAELDYNELAPFPTDSLGADAKNVPGVPQADEEDTYNDGVSLAYTADSKGVVLAVDESTDLTTSITMGKLVVKTNGDMTAYSGTDLPITGGTFDPTINNNSVSHAYLCYTVLASPVVPEVPTVIMLPLSAALIGGALLIVRRRPALVAA